ncbi:MAG: NAD-dependent epimerase/dehydratase family protein [Chloroflexi bacterium]|nr:NAD-dependent epimerase/dehydratase family protein [Chloroflexota bacterium]
MKFLVTGATGFLGSHIAEQLAREGHTVRVLVRRTSDRSFLRGLEVEEALGDITQPDTLPAAVAGVDAVVHAAGLVKARSAAEFNSVNADGTANLLSALASAESTPRFVLISSLAAHGPSEDGRPRPLDAPATPVTAYGRSKLKAEEMVRAWAANPASVGAVIIRPPVIYGPRDRQLLPFFRLARWRLAPLLGDGTNTISCVYVEDAARAVALAATASDEAPIATYTLDDGAVYTWRDLLGAIEEAVGRKALAIPFPPWAFTAAAFLSETYGRLRRRAVPFTRDKVIEMRQRHWVCSHDEISRDLGWTPRVTLKEGAALTAAWYRQHRWL